MEEHIEEHILSIENTFYTDQWALGTSAHRAGGGGCASCQSASPSPENTFRCENKKTHLLRPNLPVFLYTMFAKGHVPADVCVCCVCVWCVCLSVYRLSQYMRYMRLSSRSANYAAQSACCQSWIAASSLSFEGPHTSSLPSPWPWETQTLLLL